MKSRPRNRRIRRAILGAAAILLAVGAIWCLGGGWRRIVHVLIFADLRLHPVEPRWAHRLPWDESTYATVETEFRRMGGPISAVVLLGWRGYPHGYESLRRLVEDRDLSAGLRRTAAIQLAWINHPVVDEYTRRLAQDVRDDRMRGELVEKYVLAGRGPAAVELLVQVLPDMDHPDSIWRALTLAAGAAPDGRLVPFVLRFGDGDDSTLQEAAIMASGSIFFDSVQLGESERAQIVDMWRRAARDDSSYAGRLASTYLERARAHSRPAPTDQR